MKVILFLSTLLLASTLIADQHSDENRLLKSWGFEFNTQGLLIFQSDNKQDSGYQPWSPDISGYQLTEPEKIPAKIQQPLVISSKNKSEN